jgi:hypothetical protein
MLTKFCMYENCRIATLQYEKLNKTGQGKYKFNYIINAYVLWKPAA